MVLVGPRKAGGKHGKKTRTQKKALTAELFLGPRSKRTYELIAIGFVERDANQAEMSRRNVHGKGGVYTPCVHTVDM